MEFPERMTKFDGRKSMRVPNHVKLTGDDMEHFNFKRQQNQYECMRDALAAMGKKFTGMGVEQNPGGLSFVAWVGDHQNPYFVWQRYAANNSMGNTSTFYVRARPGESFKANTFDHQENMSLMDKVRLIEQDELRLFMIEQDLLETA